MARISKRGFFRRKLEIQTVSVNFCMKTYKAAIYARLSSSKNHQMFSSSESLEAQIEIAKKFVQQYNQRETKEKMEIVQCYTDLGKTGSHFERQGFLSLLEDIRLGKIDCVIVKDLSRLGRNYLELGNYIEKVFPFYGVRFIAISDEFDTGKSGNEEKQFAFEIKNLVNDIYAKDFSKKAKIQLQQRRMEGSYVGGLPPYGYFAKWQDGRRVLTADKNTAGIVWLIYEAFIELESYGAVVKLLGEKNINPPLVYQKTKQVYYLPQEEPYKAWNRSTVEKILKSETYLGVLAQGKSSITGRNEKNRRNKPKDEWVIIKDAHEALITRELYWKAEKIRQKINNSFTSEGWGKLCVEDSLPV